MSSEKLIFKGKTLEDLHKEIYNNSASTRKQIREIVKDLLEVAGDTKEDIVAVAPAILEYLEVGVKNDEQLLKLANLISKAEEGKSNDSFDLSDFHKLLEEQEALAKEVEKKKE